MFSAPAWVISRGLLLCSAAAIAGPSPRSIQWARISGSVSYFALDVLLTMVDGKEQASWKDLGPLEYVCLTDRGADLFPDAEGNFAIDLILNKEVIISPAHAWTYPWTRATICDAQAALLKPGPLKSWLL